MASRKPKLPNKEAAATKVIGTVPVKPKAGFVVCYKGEQITMELEAYGSFKKLLAAAIKMQDKDPYFTWDYKDNLYGDDK